MIKVHGAVIIEQGVTFAIVVVKPHVTQYTARAVAFRSEIAPFFRNMPIILMSQDRDGNPRYYGRKDIVDFLKTVKIEQIPWKTYHIY
ncbi:hypothetical protein [uncultured Selenomonas sp.]|uniref:hypothetical protein n=1 Tax=uncultured Selenomonas sp. TaxID=159275 RepID=UPI0028DB77D4|nr:hypothetical protein [uncultured Selenomonas sp.]